MGITIEKVSKAFGDFAAIKDVQLEIPSGDFIALLGPSGSGKTTLLRLIAGLESLDSGKILFNDIDYSNKTVKERKVGFVFQHYALFKHMTIFENIAFGLKVRPFKLRPSNQEIKERVYSLLKFVQLEHMADRYPSQLSGGQKQRIALARALAVEPEVLLLDEPFGALDAKVRQELRHWLREIHEKLNITTIFVTHDQEEALEMADTIVVMNQGQIEQIGSPDEVYHHPVNAFVYRFLGRVNEFIDSENEVTYIRPHEVVLRKSAQGNSVPAKVLHVHSVGSLVRIQLNRLDTNALFEAEVNTEKYQEIGPLKKGDLLYATFSNLVAFGNEQKEALTAIL
ncbi:sulfate ABC transporter ATP-binding protein [Robertmurraya yapensis]|uniref:Sulfate ABC transporter ATP-binding protein n=1 Tax=Bacillus yapensis TaxID=2492960 RepID=A0A431W9V7_9BACI|nr:sulfate ABC transporter ATP-binding protein [Bacillus yapensis]RTR32283.1 sulfate ABC transporter ATP-binding protein [Bacillus yapensis]TKS96477.1 sulfate ABC transporter ATP-binding protein [Bacillus yapensis]